MHMLLLLGALQVAAPDVPETIFQCSFGARQMEVVRNGAVLTYRYGRPGRWEMVLNGNVFYHRTLYPRGEDQTLRFTNGPYSYVVFNAFQTPDYRQEGARDFSGVLVLRNGRVIRRLDCRTDQGLYEHPIFETLPRDEENLVPAE